MNQETTNPNKDQKIPMDDVLKRMLGTPPQKRAPPPDSRERRVTFSPDEETGRESHQEKQQAR